MNLSSTFDYVLRIFLRDLPIVDDASAWHANTANAGGMGLDLSNLFGSKHLQSIQSIYLAAPIQVIEPWELVLRRRNDYFAAEVVRHTVFLTKAHQRFRALNAEPRL